MSRREYHPPTIPGQHTVEEVINHIKGLFGVHDVHVDEESGKLVVHVSSEEIYPGIDEALNRYGYLPGAGVQ
ncbi:MAG TPA: hypothetical protein GX400_19685 [Chloroflexi bacterium]|nr:hypothetical protein [Chloroflexota bacterium]